jgi:16S rRNA (cytosine1402-N4)-methyltransferase
MLLEVLAALQPMKGGRHLDGTIGLGGHAEAILEAIKPTGRLYGCDRDGAAIEKARQRLAPFESLLEIHHGNYDQVAEWVGPLVLDGALLDLGVSSMQLDQPERGFSFQTNGPLDMRMDISQTWTASDIVNEASVEELAEMFWTLGGEKESRRIARAIGDYRKNCRIQETLQLCRIVEKVKPAWRERIHPATRVFQALRMTVNDELGHIERGLHAVWSRIRLGGRLAVITFHSGEDRLVKCFGRDKARDYTIPDKVDVPALRRPCEPELKLVARKPVQPTAAEIGENPRARSAQLRVFERIHESQSKS